MRDTAEDAIANMMIIPATDYAAWVQTSSDQAKDSA